VHVQAAAARLHPHPGLRLRGAGSHRAPGSLELDNAEAASSEGFQPIVVTERRHLAPVALRNVEDRLSRLEGDFVAVEKDRRFLSVRLATGHALSLHVARYLLRKILQQARRDQRRRGSEAACTATVGYEMRLYGGYRIIPMLDLGIAADYWYRKEGEPRGETISMRTHSRQLGVFIRPHQRSPGGLLDLGARFEAGYVHSKTTLRGVSLEELSPYARLQLELVLGGGDLAGTLHVSYTLVGGQEDFEPYVPPKLGGIAFGVGMLRRF